MKFSKKEMTDFLTELREESMRLSDSNEVDEAPQYLKQHLEMLDDIKNVVSTYYPEEGVI